MRTLNKKTTVFLVLLFSLSMVAQAPYGTAGQQTAVYLDYSNGIPFGYYEYLPQNFDSNSNVLYPVLLFYHGIGEKGNGTTELFKVLANGTPKQIQQGMHFPVIVISPQKSSGWFSGNDFLTLYNYLLANYPIDPNRFYVTGLSAGGGGTWQALNAHHDKIAAAIPICGAGAVSNPAAFLQYKDIWIHHNFGDPTVTRGQSINNANRIANTSQSVMSVYPYGANTTAAPIDYTMQFDKTTQTWSAQSGVHEPIDKLSFTLYKANGHNAWSATYNNPEVYTWLFSKTLNNVLATESFKNENLTVFPIPSKDRITFSKNIDFESIEIYDLMGKKIITSKRLAGNSFDISTLESGMYFIKSDQDFIKIIKE